MGAKPMQTYYLTVCAIFKDEAQYLSEWVSFHLSQGVEHLFLYDNLSTDGGADVLAPFIEAGFVTLKPWHVLKEDGGQAAAYRDCLQEHGAQSFWIAFIDLDEFLHAVSKPLPALLQEYVRFGGLFVHWQNFGSSGHTTKPVGGVVESFTRRARTTWSRNREGKSIVRPTMVAPWVGMNTHKHIPHRFDLVSGGALVTEDFQPMPLASKWSDRVTAIAKKLLGKKRYAVGSWLPYIFNPYGSIKLQPNIVKVSKIKINHYVVKSKEEYALKMKRMSAKPGKYNETFFKFHDRNEVEDLNLKEKMRDIASG